MADRRPRRPRSRCVRGGRGRDDAAHVHVDADRRDAERDAARGSRTSVRSPRTRSARRSPPGSRHRASRRSRGSGRGSCPPSARDQQRTAIASARANPTPRLRNRERSVLDPGSPRTGHGSRSSRVGAGTRSERRRHLHEGHPAHAHRTGDRRPRRRHALAHDLLDHGHRAAGHAALHDQGLRADAAGTSRDRARRRADARAERVGRVHSSPSAS